MFQPKLQRLVYTLLALHIFKIGHNVQKLSKRLKIITEYRRYHSFSINRLNHSSTLLEACKRNHMDHIKVSGRQ